MFKKIITATAVFLCLVLSISIVNCLLSFRIDPETESQSVKNMNSAYIRNSLKENGSTPEKIDNLYRKMHTTLKTEIGEYFEYSGVIHVHTTYSDGGGTYEDIIHTADSLGLDFIIPSDHNTIQPHKDNRAKKFGDILVIPAVENSMDNGEGHFLCIGDSLSLIRSKKVPSDSVFHDAVRKSMTTILTHPFHPRKNAWKNWDIGEFTGIELFNMNTNFQNSLNLLRINRILAGFIVYFFNDEALNYMLSYPLKEMKKFDDLNLSRKVIGIGSLDAHSNVKITKRVSWKFPSYASMFNVVHTIIVTRERFNGQCKHDRNLVLNAVKQGNSYVGFSGLQDARGFLFAALSDSVEVITGDSLGMGQEAKIRIALPDSINVTTQLIRNGSILKEYSGKGFIEVAVSESGIYRVQAFQERTMLPFFQKRSFPWILSNPIYIYKKDTDVD